MFDDNDSTRTSRTNFKAEFSGGKGGAVVTGTYVDWSSGTVKALGTDGAGVAAVAAKIRGAPVARSARPHPLRSPFGVCTEHKSFSALRPGLPPPHSPLPALSQNS